MQQRMPEGQQTKAFRRAILSLGASARAEMAAAVANGDNWKDEGHLIRSPRWLTEKRAPLRGTAGVAAGNHFRRSGRFDLVVDFSAMDRNLPGGVNSQTHVVTTDLEYRDHNVIPDHDALVQFAGQDEHVHLPWEANASTFLHYSQYT